MLTIQRYVRLDRKPRVRYTFYVNPGGMIEIKKPDKKSIE